MENSTPLTPRILTPFNYLDWKEYMQIVFHNKGLYKVTMGKEFEPQENLDKIKVSRQIG